MAICHCTGKCRVPPYICSGINIGTVTEETLQLCEHHVPIKFGCTRCIEKALYEADSNQLDLIAYCQDDIKDIREKLERLDNEMKSLTNMYKNISIVVKHSQESHHRQTDEIRKISRRLDDIDKKIIDNS